MLAESSGQKLQQFFWLSVVTHNYVGSRANQAISFPGVDPLSAVFVAGHTDRQAAHSFDFFDPERLKGSAAESDGVLFRKVCHRFHYLREFANASRFLFQ